MLNDLARELKKNTDVLDMTFKKYNLQVLQFAYRPFDDNDADCSLLIEVASVEGNSIEKSVRIVVNLYDEDGEIYMSERQPIFNYDFAGYDTYVIQLYNNGRTLKEAKSARIFVSRS